MLFHVIHHDGDEEDLEEYEAVEAMTAFKQRRNKGTSRGRAAREARSKQPPRPKSAFGCFCAARRQGGLYKTVTSLDMGTLTSVLPKDRELTTQNIVGVQLFAWAVVCLFYPAILTGGLLLNTAVTPVLSIVVSGLGLGNLLLGGRVMRGDAKSAASTGLVLFSGWTVLSALAKQAGVFTGTYFGLCTVVNALTAAYCLKELL